MGRQVTNDIYSKTSFKEVLITKNMVDAKFKFKLATRMCMWLSIAHSLSYIQPLHHFFAGAHVYRYVCFTQFLMEASRLNIHNVYFLRELFVNS